MVALENLEMTDRTTKASARDLLREEYGGAPNFITPDEHSVGWIVPHVEAYEISTGEGFTRGTTLYGVSLVRRLPSGGTDRLADVSKCCFSLAEAETFLADRRETVRAELGVPGS